MGTNSSCPLPLDVLQRKVYFFSAPQRASKQLNVFVYFLIGFSVFLLGWPISSFGVVHALIWKTLNELYGQPDICCFTAFCF